MSSVTLITSMSLLSCFLICSTTASSPVQARVMRVTVGSVVDPRGDALQVVAAAGEEPRDPGQDALLVLHEQAK